MPARAATWTESRSASTRLGAEVPRIHPRKEAGPLGQDRGASGDRTRQGDRSLYSELKRRSPVPAGLCREIVAGRGGETREPIETASLNPDGKARALDRRRKSIRNIRKITRTMELISTARSGGRWIAARRRHTPSGLLVGNVSRSGLTRHPLFEHRPDPRSAALLVLSANRGLCGGYNGGVLRLAALRWKELRGEFENLRLEVSGKRGIAGLRFRKIYPDRTFTHFEDRPRLEEVEVLAKGYLEAFEAGGLDRLDIVYTKFESLTRQYPVSETLLPIGDAGRGEEEEDLEGESIYEFLPSAGDILAEIVPMSFQLKLFKVFSGRGREQRAGRPDAGDESRHENADQITHLTMTYNRARQARSPTSFSK